MNDQNAASAATPKACLISDYDQYDLSTMAAIDDAFDLAISSLTSGCVIEGTFNGIDEAKDDLVTLVSAKAGFNELMETFQRSKDRIADLEAVTTDQIKTIESTMATFHAYRAKISEMEEACQRGYTVTSPEAVATRKLDRQPYTGPGRLTVRYGDTAYDIEGTPAFIAEIRAQIGEVA